MVLIRQARATPTMAAAVCNSRNGSSRCTLSGEHSLVADLVSSTLGWYCGGRFELNG